MKITESVAETNVGRKRRHNEDNYVYAPPIFAIADGMGGANAGEVASAVAAAAVLDSKAQSRGEAHAISLVKAANLAVHKRASSDKSVSGMGTTMTIAVVQDDGTIAFGHVGDSRAYRLRGDELTQLTNDHSLVGELVRRGELTPEEARSHPQRSVITRALGTDPDIPVDSFTVETEDGDLYLLCSDGLSSMVDAATIERVLKRKRTSLHETAQALIKAANDHGGDDNITTILFTIGEGDPTGEHPAVAPVPSMRTLEDGDEEDTLHPEDGVKIPASIVAAAAADKPRTSRKPKPAEEEPPAAEPPAKSSHRGAIIAGIAIAVVAVVAVGGVFALSGGGSKKASTTAPPPATTGVTTSPTTTHTTTTVAPLTAAAVVAQAKTALAAAGTVHATGPVSIGGKPGTIDVTVAGATTQGTITVGKASFRLVETATTTYLKADSASLQTFVSPKLAKKLAGKWFSVPSSGGPFAALTRPGRTVLADALAPFAVAQSAGSASLGGTSTTAVALPAQHQTLYVSTTSGHYPLEVKTAGTKASVLRFDQWNAPFDAAAAPQASISFTRIASGH
jgi:protein phosphatase